MPPEGLADCPDAWGAQVSSGPALEGVQNNQRGYHQIVTSQDSDFRRAKEGPTGTRDPPRNLILFKIRLTIEFSILSY